MLDSKLNATESLSASLYLAISS